MAGQAGSENLPRKPPVAQTVSTGSASGRARAAAGAGALRHADRLGPSPLHLAERVRALGDRIVFGSDFPTIPHQFAAQVSGLASLGFGDDWLRNVLWSNGLRLFGLESAAQLPLRRAR